MLESVQKLLTKITKAKLASELGLMNTQTVDQWAVRGKVPVKYHIKIQELVNEFVK